MPLFGFGSKKKKVKELLEKGQFDLLVQEAIKDRKIMEALVQLLEDNNPGIVGDALLALTQVLEAKRDVIKKHISGEHFRKIMGLVNSRNPYVKENAMILTYSLVKAFPELIRDYRKWMVQEIRKGLLEGNKEEKGFLLVLIGELGLGELRPLVEELTGVQDKVVLPFEGKKWVPLGDIAKETLEKLSA
nr:hypothetical protein [Thermococcus sp.]